MSSAYLILDMADSGNWDGFLRIGERVDRTWRIPPGKLSTVLHETREIAEAEALRLQRAHPDGQFVVFEAITSTQRVEVATHVNLEGKPLITETQARIVPAGEVTL